MRAEFRGVRRSAALLALVTILATHAAMAADRDGGRDLSDPFNRAKRFIVKVFSRFGLPPG